MQPIPQRLAAMRQKDISPTLITGAASKARAGTNVVLGVTGSIAAYKAAELVRLLVKRGLQVRVIMTHSATKFIGTETMAALSGHPVVTEFWNSSQDVNTGFGSGAIEHIDLADWADVIAIAPATADTIAKLAHGIADTPLLATVLAAQAPLIVAPAMNVNMLKAPRTKANLETLATDGVKIIDPGSGELACGWQGEGRLAEPEIVAAYISRELRGYPLRGKRIVISAGPTREAIDEVRFISNRSSGKMGVALAREAFLLGAEVILVHGPLAISPPPGVRSCPVVAAAEMQMALEREISADARMADCVIMAAAVCDVAPTTVAPGKLKKNKISDSILLSQNPDIIGGISKRRGEATRPLLVAFVVETGDQEGLREELGRKLKQKGVDWIIGNLAQEAFDLDTNRVTMLSKRGTQRELPIGTKDDTARMIFAEIFGLKGV